MFEFYLTVSTTENDLEVLKDAVKYVLRITSVHNKGAVADTLRNIWGGGGARTKCTEKILNLNPGNGICSILRTHFVKN